jgi:hypothetical protein
MCLLGRLSWGCLKIAKDELSICWTIADFEGHEPPAGDIIAYGAIGGLKTLLQLVMSWTSERNIPVMTWLSRIFRGHKVIDRFALKQK